MAPLSSATLTRALASALAVLRGVQAASWPLAMAVSGGVGVHRTGLAWLSWAAALVAGAVNLGWILVRARPSRRLIWADLAVAALTLVTGGLSVSPGMGLAYAHPSFALAVGAAVTAAVFVPLRTVAVSVAVLLVCWLAGVLGRLPDSATVLSPLATNLATLVLPPLVVAWLVPRVRNLVASAEADRTTAALAVEHLAAHERRETERARQYRTVHDTVLGSLSALARGTLDPQDEQVRLRLGADADYLRGLIVSGESRAGMYLIGQVARLSRDFSAQGLRVHPRIADVPDGLDQHLLAELVECLTECLNNVVKHAGVREAWVTITGTQTGGVEVLVVDRGRGFDPSAPRTGLGLTHSLSGRMAALGGAVEIDSEPGQGTTVELRWPQ